MCLLPVDEERATRLRFEMITAQSMGADYPTTELGTMEKGYPDNGNGAVSARSNGEQEASFRNRDRWLAPYLNSEPAVWVVLCAIRGGMAAKEDIPIDYTRNNLLRQCKSIHLSIVHSGITQILGEEP